MPSRTNDSVAPDLAQSPQERAIQRWEAEGGEIPVLRGSPKPPVSQPLPLSLFSRFQDPAQAERAMITIIHRGGRSADLTLIFPSGYTGIKLSATNSWLIPGLGRILGGGPVARSLAELDTPNLSAALSGGVAAYLLKLGLAARVASDTALALLAGDAVLMVACPTGSISEYSVTEILHTYQAQCYGRADCGRKVIFAI